MFVSKNLKIIVGMDRKFVKAQQRLRLGSLTQPRRPMVSRVGLRTAARDFGKPKLLFSQKDAGYLDQAAAAYACDTTGTLTLLTVIPQGVSVNQRVGKKIALTSVQLRGNLIAGTTGTTSDVAVLIVYDRRPSAATAITDILKTISSNALNNDDNTGRFKILRRWDMSTTGNATTPATGNEIKEFSQYFKVPALPVIYKALGTGAIADHEEGALYMVTVGNTVAGTTSSSLQTTIRVRFQDI